MKYDNLITFCAHRRVLMLDIPVMLRMDRLSSKHLFHNNLHMAAMDKDTLLRYGVPHERRRYLNGLGLSEMWKALYSVPAE